MTNLNEIKFLDLLPPNFKYDNDAIAASSALDGQFSIFVNNINKVMILPNIDTLDEPILDLLAVEFHVDFYSSTLPVETKKTLIKTSLPWHERKGTPSAVEELITSVFGDGEVKEWKEYGGEPYHFKILTNNTQVTDSLALSFLEALNNSKNIRSILDTIQIILSGELNEYYGFAVHVGDKLTINQVG